MAQVIILLQVLRDRDCLSVYIDRNRAALEGAILECNRLCRLRLLRGVDLSFRIVAGMARLPEALGDEALGCGSERMGFAVSEREDEAARHDGRKQELERHGCAFELGFGLGEEGDVEAVGACDDGEVHWEI